MLRTGNRPVGSHYLLVAGKWAPGNLAFMLGDATPLLPAVASDPFVHPALLYGDVKEYLSATVSFVRAGLDAGDPVAVAVPEPNLSSIRRALGHDAAHVQLLDMADVGRNPGRIIGTVLLAFANAHAPRRVRIIGEPIWAERSAAEYPACAQHEALINRAFAGRDAIILCPYDRSRLNEHWLAEALRTHPTVQDGHGCSASPDFAPQAVIDAHNVELAVPTGIPVASAPYDAATLAAVRRFAAYQARLLGLDADRVGDVTLGVSELATNSVRHGGGGGLLQIWASDGYVICQVQDSGTLTDPLAGRHAISTQRASGRGLMLAHRTADLIRAHTAANSTTIRLYYRLA